MLLSGSHFGSHQGEVWGVRCMQTYPYDNKEDFRLTPNGKQRGLFCTFYFEVLNKIS